MANAYDLTPRQVMHYAAMAERLRSEELLEDFNVSLTAARGDEKSVRSLARDKAERAAHRPSENVPELVARPAKHSEAAATDAALRAAGLIR